jgi:hypothetical protein
MDDFPPNLQRLRACDLYFTCDQRQNALAQDAVHMGEYRSFSRIILRKPTESK